MIPIHDTLRSSTYPVVTHALIGVNLAVFLFQMTLGPELERFVYFYGLVPARYSVPRIAAYFSLGQQLFALLSFMFLHGGFWHLLGNMWSLYIFGDNVEDHLGPLRYLGFYLLCGLVSGLTHMLLNLGSNVPTIGASGAIAGVMGAYFLLHPRARILTLIPIFFIPYFIEIPAFFFLGVWLFLQFLNAAGSQAGMTGIAWWAHIGGFIGGMLLVKVLDQLPVTGVSRRVRQAAAKKRSYHLQVIHPSGTANDPNLFGEITITPFEAATGTDKLVNIPWGFQKRLFRVAVPPGIHEGNTLRLKQIGRQLPDGRRGDLLLKVRIQS
ncbi:MAG: rhomboid family intramembrane serine protease [Desulfobacteraceae bacterium]|nr:rhomboid family intramembrane serine protease [Desulfobacteraceae bacterium]